MYVLFWQAITRYLKLVGLSLWPPRESAARRSLRRFALMLVFMPVLGVVQALHWLGFLCDEIFFRGYRRVEVCAPVFVTGVPRSGTTILHRTLSLDDQYTTFSTWECLFAPSVTQRRIVHGIARLDSWVGQPLARLLGWLERKVFAGFDEIHDMSLKDSEEDYFVFMPLLSCFILVVPFPYAAWLWDMGQFDRRISSPERARVMRYYRRCIQRHLYANGSEKCFLSKNASFPPLINSLLKEFPDARFILCVRDPSEVVPSQLSSLRDGMAFFSNDPYDKGFADKLIEQLHFYYCNLLDAPIPEHQSEWVTMMQMKRNMAGSIEGMYHRLGIALSEEFLSVLKEQGAATREYRSAHTYSLDEFGLDEREITERFSDVYTALDYKFATLT